MNAWHALLVDYITRREQKLLIGQNKRKEEQRGFMGGVGQPKNEL